MLDKVGVRLQVGDAAPDFAFASEAFGSVSTASLRGKRYVMYFYPKDDTPGCTREACAFRDNLPRFGAIGVKVFGVSADDEKSHLRFARKHSLPFKLIPDPDHVICEAFGTWVEKNMYGRSYMGVARSTFVIGPDGKIEKIWEKVAPDGHAEEVYAWLNGDPVPLPFKPAAAVKPVVAKPTAATPIKAMPTVPKSSPVSAKTGASAKPTAATLKPAATPIKPKPKAAPTQPAVKTKLAPAKPKPATAKPAAKKAIPKKGSAAKSVARKGSAKNVSAKKVLTKKAAVKKPVTKPALTKKAPPKKPTVKKMAMKKSVAKKSPAKKVPAKKPRR